MPMPLSPVALAWVLARGEHIHIIPGTRREKYLIDNLGERRLVPLGGYDLRAFGGEEVRHRAAHAGTCTGDDRYLAFESHRAPLSLGTTTGVSS